MIKHKKIIFLITFLFLFSCNKNVENKSEENLKNNVISDNLNSLEEEKTQSWTTTPETHITLPSEEKMKIIRQRFLLRTIIQAWDNYMETNQYILALNKYKKVLEQNPEDLQIIKKIIQVYTELKQFNKNVELIEPLLVKFDDKELINSYIINLFYSWDFTKKTDVENAANKIKALKISLDEKMYYVNAINCWIDSSVCKQIYKDYFSKHEITFDKLKNINNAFTNYANFKLNDEYYENTLLMWTFFQDKLFPISNLMWEKTLKHRKNYVPVLEMLWRWNYQLWKYTKAKEYLIKLYNLDTNNWNIAYLLWDLFFKVRDYVSSNMYFNVALKNSNTKINIVRKLAYNYFLLWDKTMLLVTFWELVNTPESSIIDYSLAIYHSIMNKDLDKAEAWAKSWIEKFKWQKWSEMFYWYLWRIYRENNLVDLAWENLKNWLHINSSNPLILLNLWYLEESKQNYSIALIYLKKCEKLNWEWEFWLLATKEIKKIEKHLEDEKKEKESKIQTQQKQKK